MTGASKEKGRSASETKPWWWPQVTDTRWCQEIREDYPEDAADLSDDEIREEYADGARYATTWDHVGDAYDEYEPLADAFLAHTTLQDENERLREALEPFVAAMFFFEGDADERTVSIGRWHKADSDVFGIFYGDMKLTVADFRRARAALNKEP